MVLCDTLWHSGLANQIVSFLNLEPAAEKEENAMQEGFQMTKSSTFVNGHLNYNTYHHCKECPAPLSLLNLPSRTANANNLSFGQTSLILNQQPLGLQHNIYKPTFSTITPSLRPYYDNNVSCYMFNNLQNNLRHIWLRISFQTF